MGRYKRVLAAVMVCALLLTGGCSKTGGEAAPVRASNAREDMKAVWVSSVYNLDYPAKGTTDPSALKREADRILENAAEMGMNAIILQVRPSCDALYPSELFPWSRYLTGSQSAAPKSGFDPLEYWVEQAHALGLELHAWLNPYRITKAGRAELDEMSDKSPAKQNPGWVVEYEKNFYLNPGLPEVRELVIMGAEEIVRNYNVDGIHLDDYFYPGKGFDDAAAFAKYGGGFSEVADWRRENVNLLIQSLDQRLHAIKPGLSFGVSPSGVWRDKKNDALGSGSTGGYESYNASYADSRKWVKEGWVDYICPQIYWYIGHKTMDYKTIAQWWADTVRGTGVKLYIGMADYQACNSDPASAWHGTKAIREQLALNKTIPEVAGEVHFRYQFLEKHQELKNLYLREYAGVDVGPDGETLAWLSRLPAAEQSHWGAKYYGKLGAMGIVTGKEDGTYSPEENMTRGSMCKLIFSSIRELNGTILAAHIYDNPVPDTVGTWSEQYIVPLFHAGYLSVGDYPKGFGGGQDMSRSEVVKLLMRAMGYTDDGSVTSTGFPDVERDHYYIAKAVELGVITGNEDGTFSPDDSITRATAAAMLCRAMG